MLKTATSFIPVILISSLLGACSKSSSSDIQIQYLSHDYVVQTMSSDFPKIDNSVEKDCEDQIRKATCVSDLEDLKYDVNCSNDRVTPEQLGALNKVVADLPPIHKKMMCALGRIQIQDKIFSMAYASGMFDTDQKWLGSMIGLRSDILKGQSVHRDLNSWKEQLNFGLSKPKDPDVKVSPLGPTIVEGTPKSQSPYLFVYVHELNHLLDALNWANSEVNYETCVKDEKDEHILHCKADESSYSRLSWGDTFQQFTFSSKEEYEEYMAKHGNPLPPKSWESKFPLLAQLCFYYCKKTISPSLMANVYQELNATNFVTSYSSVNEVEDFAEAATIWAFEQHKIPYVYQILSPDKKTYFDAAKQFHSPGFKTKREWLDKFFARDLKFTYTETK